MGVMIEKGQKEFNDGQNRLESEVTNKILSRKGIMENFFIGFFAGIGVMFFCWLLYKAFGLWVALPVFLPLILLVIRFRKKNEK